MEENCPSCKTTKAHTSTSQTHTGCFSYLKWMIMDLSLWTQAAEFTRHQEKLFFSLRPVMLFKKTRVAEAPSGPLGDLLIKTPAIFSGVLTLPPGSTDYKVAALHRILQIHGLIHDVLSFLGKLQNREHHFNPGRLSHGSNGLLCHSLSSLSWVPWCFSLSECS